MFLRCTKFIEHLEKPLQKKTLSVYVNFSNYFKTAQVCYSDHQATHFCILSTLKHSLIHKITSFESFVNIRILAKFDRSGPVKKSRNQKKNFRPQNQLKWLLTCSFTVLSSANIWKNLFRKKLCQFTSIFRTT